MGLYCVGFHMATSVLWSSSNDSTCDISLTSTNSVDTIKCVHYQIYNLICVDFHMATSVLWSSSNDIRCDISLTIMSGVDNIKCVHYQIYNLNPW